MKLTRLFGIIILVMAFVVAILPQFSTCESQGRLLSLANGNSVPMKCSWTARGEFALSLPLMAVGALMVVSRREGSRNLAIVGGILGIFVALLPVSVIGVCATPTMLCASVMKPAMMAAGTIIAASCVASVFVSQREPEKA